MASETFIGHKVTSYYIIESESGKYLSIINLHEKKEMGYWAVGLPSAYLFSSSAQAEDYINSDKCSHQVNDNYKVYEIQLKRVI
jgi:hypothetical protein